MASLMELLRLLHDEAGDEPQPQPRRRNRRAAARQQNPPPTGTLSNSGTQNMEGLINNAGYVEGHGNGSIVYGSFDSSTKTYN
ncbi:hypothetical protein RYX36_002186 [Vicia faba]